MKASELVSMSKEDLLKKLADLEEGLLKLRFRVKNVASKEVGVKMHEFKQMRRDIARVKTVLRSLGK